MPIPAVKLNVPFVTHFNDHIRREERRAHIKAPLSRISGSSSTPKAKMFAIPFVPAKLPRSHLELTDDDTPIIVKVQYHADAGGPLSEHVVRQAIDEQFQQQRWNRRRKHQPLIVSFLGQTTPKPVDSAHRSRSISCKQPFHPPPKPVIHQQRSSLKGISPIQSTRSTMAAAPRQTLAAPSGEVFRPPAVSDIPELSKESLLSMLNQIPDLQGRRFNIEYAAGGAPEGYPFPSSSAKGEGAYPDPVVIDQLPQDIIQHVKTSNNPAITAALDAAIQREQRAQSSGQQRQGSNAIRHVAQHNETVQDSRPASSSESEGSSTEVSSSEESDSEELQAAFPSNF